MRKQFLLNPDGSIPQNVNVAALEEAGIPLVIPTEMPRSSGMIAVEQDPQQDEHGVWRQVWTLEPAPEPIASEPEDPLGNLTIEQKEVLIALLTKPQGV
jgi:hypothetical protein